MSHIHRNSLLALATAAIALVGPDPAQAADWVIMPDLTAAQYEDYFLNQMPAGFRPISISADGSEGNARFTLVAVKDPGVPSASKHGFDGAEYQAEFNDLVDLGYRPVAADGYGGDPVLHVAVFIKDGLPEVDWAARHELTDAELQDEHDDMDALGLRMTWLAGYGEGSARRFSAIWERSNGWSVRVKWGLDEAEWQPYIEDRAKEGYRLDVFTVYDDPNDPLYGGIFVRPDGPNWEIQPEWIARHGQTLGAFDEMADGLGATDFQPLCAIQYDAGADRFGSTWFEDLPDPVFDVTGPDVPSLSNFDLSMEQFMKSRKISRGALAVTKDGRLVLERAYTYAPPGVAPTTPESRFRIASVSKPLTAVTLLKMVDDGLIGEAGETFDQRLDTKLVDIDGFDGGGWVSDDFPDVTVRHLLQHRGGWDRNADSGFDPLYRDITIAQALGVGLPILPEHVVQYMKGFELDFTPGSDYAYSNFGYFLLGQVAEAVSGQPYADWARSNVFCPMGASTIETGRTSIDDALPDEVDYRHPMNAFADDVMGGDELVKRPYGYINLENRTANGGWVATARELARFASDFASPEASEVLSPEAIAFMWSPTAESGGGYCAGWSVGANNIRSHRGGFSGTRSFVVIRRDDNVTFSILLNQTSADAETPVKDLDNDIYTALNDAADLVGEADWPAGDMFDEIECENREWNDGFDTYPVGPLAGRGGWESWEDQREGADFEVTDALARSAPHSVAIDDADDAVRRFDVNEGRWQFTTWLFVPAAMDDLQHFILLNTYPADDNGHWSLQLEVDGANGLIADRNSAAQLPLVKGAWTRIEVDIDLDADTQTVRYNGEHLLSKGWSDGVSEGGATSIAAVDLYGTGSVHEIYYDDMSLDELTEAPCPADLDGSGAVDFGDILAILAAWGNAGGPEDLDKSGIVDFGDILVVLSMWGPCV